MDVRYGPARVTFSGDETVARGHLGRALQLLWQTQERARLGGLSVLGNQWRLDDDSYCYAVIAGGIAAVHIVSGYADETKVLVPVGIPDFVSGVVENGYIEDVAATLDHPAYKQLATFHPTHRCAMEYGLADVYQPIERLAVEPWTAFDELRNNSDSPLVFSQYTGLVSTMYSGTMRQVVQALMGFGHQRHKGNHDFSQYDLSTGGAVSPMPPSLLSQYTKDVAKNGVQIRYDWRFVRTHGITRAADGLLWLVEIGINNGAIAMPLPLYPETSTAAFRLRMATAGDTEAMTLLDAFGGFPTGEAFPIGAQMDAWVRAGRVLRLLSTNDLQPFYDHSAYSSAMGWAFNTRGDEAHNTAWRVGDDGYLRGIHDAINIFVGNSVVVAGSTNSVLKVWLAPLRNQPAYANGIDAAIWKVDRMTTDQMTEAMRQDTLERVYAYVDALVLPPMAVGSAHRTRSSEGFLVHRGKVGNLIKFPEPLLGLLVSVDMRPEIGAVDMVTRSDTTVHVFFAENDLKWVKYFNDERPGTPPSISNDYEDCMFVGAWSQHEVRGGGTLMKALYSSDFDDRIELPQGSTDTEIVGRDLGYCQAWVNDCLAWIPHATYGRTKRFSTHTTTIMISGQMMSTGVAVPFGDREAYYYAAELLSGQHITTETLGYKYLEDPWRYFTYRPFGGYAPPSAPHPDGCNTPALPSRTVMLPGHYSGYCRYFSDSEIQGTAVYRPGGCSDFADEGPWSSLCANADAGVYFIPPPPGFSTVDNPPSTGHYDVWLVNSTRFGEQRTAQVDSLSFGLWSLISPSNGDDNTSADQYIAETNNVFGEADSMRYEKNLNDSFKVLGVPHWPEMESGGLTYIGVIDGV